MPEMFEYDGIKYDKLQSHTTQELINAKSMLAHQVMYSDLASEMYSKLVKELERRGYV